MLLLTDLDGNEFAVNADSIDIVVVKDDGVTMLIGSSLPAHFEIKESVREFTFMANDA